MKYKKWWRAFILFALCDLALWLYLSSIGSPVLRVAFLDVGQGDAILIRAPSGRTMLIDGGPGKNILAPLSKNLPLFAGTIDLLLETHPDTDHVGGLPDVAEKYAVFGVMKPCINSANPYDRALHEIIFAKSEKEICAQAGQVIDLGGGAKMEILHAGSVANGDSDKNTNIASVVARLTYGQTVFLFTGDTDIKVEKYLYYAEPDKLTADVLKVSHHGSRESNDLDFLNQVKPDIAVISVGADNRYGHPHQETLYSLAAVGSTVLRTDLLGTIRLESNGVVVRQK